MIVIRIGKNQAEFSIIEPILQWYSDDEDFVRMLNRISPSEEDILVSTPFRRGKKDITGVDSLWYEAVWKEFGESVEIVKYTQDIIPKEKENSVF